MDSDTQMRLAAFAHVRQLIELRDSLTVSDLAPGFQFGGVRIPLINPQRGIFKPGRHR
jgi:putative restriction endonuclease